MTSDVLKGTIKVLLVEDHPMFRERLAAVISRRRDMTVCGEADNANDALALVEKTRPQIAIVDLVLSRSNGLDLLKGLKARGIEIPSLVLSMHDETLYAERALRAGARGYVTKYEASSEVTVAIDNILKGKIYLSRHMSERMVTLVQSAKTMAKSTLI